MKKLLSVVVACCALAALPSQANLVVNGDFESHGAYNAQGWNYFDSIPGWASGDDTDLEVGRPSVYGVSGFGDAVMELDTTENVVATQVIGATPGATYTLSFWYALRENVLQSSGSLEVYWNGLLVDTLSPNSQTMAFASYSVLAGPGLNNTLEFMGTGTSDSYGALIDEVAVVPEPTTIVAGALLLLPFGLSAVRRFRK